MIEANILARLGIGQMKMDVQAAAGAVGERLGHVRDDRSVLLGDLGAQHAEEGDSVGGDERVGVIEIDFVLPVRVLVIDLVRAPAELIERRRHVLQIAHRGGHRAIVVARLRERIDSRRIPRADRTVAVARHEKVLRFHADVENEPFGFGLVQHTLQVGP